MYTVLMRHWPMERKAKSHSLSTQTRHCLAVVQWILQRLVITLSQVYRTSQQGKPGDEWGFITPKHAEPPIHLICVYSCWDTPTCYSERVSLSEIMADKCVTWLGYKQLFLNDDLKEKLVRFTLSIISQGYLWSCSSFMWWFFQDFSTSPTPHLH